jgi:hypothetical protein
MKKEKKPQKLKYYKDRAWKAFSEYIRRRDSNNGFCKCVTCEMIDEWRYLQAGHFVAGRNNSILFLEDNCHAQCVGCNFFGKNSRSYGKYYEFMKAHYGAQRIDEIILLSNRIVQFDQSDYERIEAEYKFKIKELEDVAV